jgi:hypothetical protein
VFKVRREGLLNSRIAPAKINLRESIVAKENNPALRLIDGALEYRRSDGEPIWTTSVKSLVLMAEYTTNEGPYIDDYFLVFVTVENGSQYFATASFYSDGRDEVVKQLAEQWAAAIELGLANSTDWKSRVVWPPELVGHDYFEFVEVQPNNVLARLRKATFGPVYEYFPCKSVRAFLNSDPNR